MDFKKELLALEWAGAEYNESGTRCAACPKCRGVKPGQYGFITYGHKKRCVFNRIKSVGGSPFVWVGQCLKCGECYEKETQEDKPPFHDEDGKPIGVICPGCRKRGLTMCGVVHFSKHSEDFVPEDVRGDRERFGSL